MAGGDRGRPAVTETLRERLERAYARAAAQQESWLWRQSRLTAAATAALVESLTLSPEARVLDVGTGTGAWAVPLAMRVPLGWVVGVDQDAQALAAACRLAAAVGLVNVEFRAADAGALPFAPESFDLVASRFFFQHQTDPLPALREMCRVARVGGSVLAVDVDDGAALTWPEPPPAAAAVLEAYRRHEARQGRDRQVGRKLYDIFRRGGLTQVQVAVWPLPHWGAAGEPQAREAAGVLREQVAASGLDAAAEGLSEDELERGLAELERSYRREAFRLQLLFVARGTKEASG